MFDVKSDQPRTVNPRFLFPRWFGAEITVTDPTRADANKLRHDIQDALEQKGAACTRNADGTILIRKGDARGKWNPISFCREGWVRIDETAAGIRIIYRLDMLWLALGNAAMPLFVFVFLVPAALLHGATGPALAIGAFSFLPLVLNYFALRGQARSLFANAIAPNA